MRKLKLLLACLFVASISLLNAQTKTASGTVISSDDGLPVVGARVVVKGTTQGTITNTDGWYSLTVPASANVLVVSLVGMMPVEVVASPNQRVTMEPDVSELEDIIVVGYLTTRREAKTGSLVSVNTEDISDIPAVSFDKMLSGKMAGVSITSSTGQPGSSSNIRVRGTSSITAGNEPLYVIDGVPVMSGDQSYFTNTSNAVAAINPNDIENITILKDAASTSIYGSRAANGVILITTKSGREGKSKITVRSRFGASKLNNDNNYGVMSGPELLGYMRQAISNAGLNPDDPGGRYYRPESLLDGGHINWMDHLTRSGNMQEYEINMSGGSAKTKYYSSASYSNNEGIYYGVGYERMQFRANVDHELNNKWKSGARINVAYQEGSDIPMQSLYYSNPAFAGLTILPWTKPYTDDGMHNSVIPENSNTNPRATADYDDQWEKQYRFNGNFYIQWQPIKGLTLKSTNAADMTFNEGRRYWSNEAHNYSAGYPKLQTSQMMYRLLTTSNTAVYENLIDRHNIRFLLGQEANHRYAYEFYEMSENLNPDIPHHIDGNATNNVAYGNDARTMLSFFGIVDYSFNAKYFLQLSGRYDGSSKFGANERWGFFPSIGGSWNIHGEDFMNSVRWVQTLKLRASYGVTGNDNITNYQQYGTYTSTVYNGVTGLRPSAPSNENLSWEKNNSWNIGVDFRFMNKYTATLDFYSRKSTDMLLWKNQSGTSGFGSVLQNIGSLKNSGIEFQFEANLIDNNNWKWDAGFNISHNVSKLLSLAEKGEEMMAYAGDSRIQHIVGESLMTYWLKDYYGVDPQTGEALWRTADGLLTNNFNAARYTKSGSPEPKYTGGVNTSVSWKGISFSTVGEFKGGNKVLIIENRYVQSDGTEMSMNQARSALNYWKKPGDTGVSPKPIAGNNTSSNSFASNRYVEKGDYFRIKDITLSYQLPANIVQKAGFSSIRVYGSALNLYTFHDVNFFDPERGIDGMGYGIYPMTKTIVFGFDLSF